MLVKVISGYQTGADRAGIHAAYGRGILTGGWIPKGRHAQDGQISLEDAQTYNLTETDDWHYRQRTEFNVRDSSGTVIFGNCNSPGCKLILSMCKKHHKPYIINPSPEELHAWILRDQIQILNVAGNREESNPGIYQSVMDTLLLTFAALEDKKER